MGKIMRNNKVVSNRMKIHVKNNSYKNIIYLMQLSRDEYLSCISNAHMSYMLKSSSHRLSLFLPFPKQSEVVEVSHGS